MLYNYIKLKKFTDKLFLSLNNATIQLLKNKCVTSVVAK